MDVEKVFYLITDYFKSKINDKIAAINTEKGESLLNPISSDAWLEGHLSEKVLSYDQSVLSYIEDIQVNVNNHAIAETITMEVDLITHQRHDFMDYKRILRYQRAFKEVAQDAWSGISALRGFDSPVVRVLNPIDITLPGSKFSSKVIGVQIEFALFNN